MKETVWAMPEVLMCTPAKDKDARREEYAEYTTLFTCVHVFVCRNICRDDVSSQWNTDSQKFLGTSCNKFLYLCSIFLTTFYYYSLSIRTPSTVVTMHAEFNCFSSLLIKLPMTFHMFSCRILLRVFSSQRYYFWLAFCYVYMLTP